MAAIFIAAGLLMPAHAHAAALEGEVVSLAPMESGLWKVVIKAAGGKQSLVLSAKSAILKEVRVEDIKQGDRLASTNRGSQGGTKGLKAPFGNMSAGAKKMLGLPNVPNIPAVPNIPNIPNKQQMKGVAPKGGGAAPQPGGGNPGVPQPGGGKSAAKEEPPPVKTQDEMLQEKGFQNEKLLFPPTEGEIGPGEEVTQVRKVDQGFEVTLLSSTGKPEKQTYAPGKKVVKVLSPGDLKKKDRVSLDFNEKDKTVTQLKIK